VRSGKPPSAIKLTGLGFTGAALSTVLLNQSTASTDYPYAAWGNLAVLAASLCFAGYMTINNRLVESARSRAVSPAEVERAKLTSSAPERQHAEQEHELLRARAQDAAQAKLRAVPFFSQVASACVGLAFFIPQVSLGGGSVGNIIPTPSISFLGSGNPPSSSTTSGLLVFILMPASKRL
jgi:hypothetical protein